MIDETVDFKLLNCDLGFCRSIEPAIWSSGNAFFSSCKSEVQISGRSNRKQCCQRLATVTTFFEGSCIARAQGRGDGPRQLVSRFAILRNSAGIMNNLT